MRWLPPLRRPLTWLAILGAAGLVLSAVAGVRTPGPFGVQQPQVWVLVGLLPGYVTGLVLCRLCPAEPIPRLLVAMSSCMAVATALGAACSLVTDGTVTAGGTQPAWAWSLVAAEYVFDIAGPAAMGTMFVLFPDGVVRRRYERMVLWAFATAIVVLPPLLVVSGPALPAPEYASSRAALVASPFWWPALSVISPAVTVIYHVATQLGLVGAVLLVLRYRRLPDRQRLQTYWLVLAAVAVAADVAVVTLLSWFGVLPRAATVTTFYAVWVPVLAFIPAAIWIALLRHRLFDVHLVVRRSLLYGAASSLIAVGLLAAATAFGVTAAARLPLVVAVIAIIVVVLALAPVRRRLNRWASNRVYGRRPTGAELLGEFGETLEHAYDLAELAPRAAGLIVDGLGVAWARLVLVLPGSDVAEHIGSAGDVPDRVLRDGAPPDLSIDLVDHGDVVGRIECGPPIRGGGIGDEDRQLLLTVARQTALAVRATHFSAELAAQLAETRRQADALAESRRRLVTAQDTERRRLERDLHDGVQQEVVAVTTQLRLGLNQMDRDLDAARCTFEESRRAAAAILVGLRDLVQGIRPPVLADQGLLAAVEARAARIPIGVAIDAGPRLRTERLGDEVESAAYFLVSEALTNVLKHAATDQVSVRMRVEQGALCLSVRDNGVGFVPADAAETASGTGLPGLADRVQAIGGTLHIRSAPGRGTDLQARLPIRAVADV